jgi:hypothetical protein
MADKKSYVFLFNLCCGFNMKKWESLINSLNIFKNFLKPKEVVAVIGHAEYMKGRRGSL